MGAQNEFQGVAGKVLSYHKIMFYYNGYYLSYIAGKHIDKYTLIISVITDLPHTIIETHFSY